MELDARSRLRGCPPSAGALFAWSTAAVLLAALVGLPLFQDGASYLLELLTTGSAVRHHRLSARLFQLPAIVARRLVSEDLAVPVVRTAFCLGYALVPILTLGLSWAIVRRTRPGAIVWPGLVVLFANLVAFSWVSELLIAMQLAWPLLLVWLVAPGGPSAVALTAVLLPVVWWLHPLSAVLLAIVGAACVLVARRDPARRRTASAAAAVLGVAALARVAAAPVMLSSYETGFLERSELVGYLFTSRWENVLVLAAALAAGILVAGAERAPGGVRGAHRAALALAIAAAGVLASQYVVPTHTFPLKTGLAVWTSAVLMLLATRDAAAPAAADRERARVRLTRGLALVFAAVVGAKSLVWHAATTRLGAALAPSAERCREIGELAWLARAPYAIVDTWALPSLALVSQDRPPRTLLLADGDCARFRETGMVRIDPWTTLPETALVPPLD